MDLIWIALVAAALAVPAAIADEAGSSSLEAKAQKALKLARKARAKANDALEIAESTSKKRGPQGPPGEKGDPGDPAANLTATVSETGSLVHGNRVSEVSRLSLGRYLVTFEQDVSACTLVGTPGSASASESVPPHRSLSTAPHTGNPNAVFVVTRNANGVELNTAFHLAALC